MVKGFCSSCGKEVGGFMKPSGYQCPSCKKAYCHECTPKRGLLIKSPHCPECGIKLTK